MGYLLLAENPMAFLVLYGALGGTIASLVSIFDWHRVIVDTKAINDTNDARSTVTTRFAVAFQALESGFIIGAVIGLGYFGWFDVGYDQATEFAKITSIAFVGVLFREEAKKFIVKFFK